MRPTSTSGGLPIGPLHAKADRAGPQHWRDALAPVAVFQRIDHPDPSRSAAIARAEIDGGATGLDLVLAGSRSARSFGVECRSRDDLLTVLADVDLDRTSLRCAFPATARAAMLDRVLGALQTRNRPADHPNLDLAADPFEAATGGAAAIAAAARQWAGDLRGRGVAAAFLRVDGRPHHEAGASAAQELAAVLSAGLLCLRALEEVGLLRTKGAIRFTLAAHTDQTLTMTKFRAFRRLWARVEQACGIGPAPARLHGETGWRALARSDPWTNLLRTAIACAGAILGGADSVSVLPFTSALGLPDPFARRLARNTPLVLLHEAHLARVADPCAGAGVFEAMTDRLCAEAWRMFQRLEGGGGLAAALASGAWGQEVAEVAESRRAALAGGHATLVGVTAFRAPDDALPPVLLPRAEEAALPGERAWLPSIREAAAFEGVAAARPSPAGEATP